MALTVVTSGTTGALTVGGPETTLSTQTPGSPVTYVVRVDCSALVVDESVSLLIYTKALTGGVEGLEERHDFTWLWGDVAGNAGGVGDPVILRSFPIPTDISFRAALLQLSGTGRTFPWKLFSM